MCPTITAKNNSCESHCTVVAERGDKKVCFAYYAKVFMEVGQSLVSRTRVSFGRNDSSFEASGEREAEASAAAAVPPPPPETGS